MAGDHPQRARLHDLAGCADRANAEEIDAIRMFGRERIAVAAAKKGAKASDFLALLDQRLGKAEWLARPL